MLPPLQDANQTTGDSADGRVEARIREITISGMVQATAMARVSRTLSSKSQSSTAGLYRPGDLVDYHRRQGPKDEPNWHGPVPVVADRPSEGGVIIKLAKGDYPY